ncbi:hypothetical protein NUU61_000568 [Penicillium alfredii]|uniref:Pyrroline-5-carboxylate reductase catalytic N-terminal domain-containing protein n=1 Tax=Penicillium alfredii TaxID=1506179 RepID=A0A9W9KPV3_9EURO|nr:uncharacterized protein NUU61_000568 [Penicillium alfredii]KAJ5114809.1 hypothetical protein NUU61_000568 [Penicillium alfredii]
MTPAERVQGMGGEGGGRRVGGAILQGVLDAAFSNTSSISNRPISKFIACTKSPSSAERLQAYLSAEHKPHVKVVSGQTVQSMQEADVVVLGFKPFMAVVVVDVSLCEQK